MLDTIALGFLIFASIILFYGIIVIHDIAYDICVHRNHPHQEVIHDAGWISLFTLHAIWPFLWIWATLYREDSGWGFEKSNNAKNPSDYRAQINSLRQRVAYLEQLNQVDRSANAGAFTT
jgi:hypothetical protein